MISKKIRAAYIFTILLLCSLTFHSCRVEEPLSPTKGNATFSFDKKERENDERRLLKIADPAFVLLSVEDSQGNKIETGKKLEVITFGQGFISESLELGIGSYRLSSFSILDASGSTIYASPVEGSALAKYVNDPLPIEFSVTENATTTVLPQVLEVRSSDTPEIFGYASFGFEIVTIKKVKRLERRDVLDSLREYITFEYDEKSRLIKKSVYLHYIESNSDYLSTLYEYEYLDSDLLKSIKKVQGDGSSSEQVYHFNSQRQLVKVETYSLGKLYTYFTLTHSKDTIKAQRFDFNNKPDSKRHEYIFANNNLTRYNRYQNAGLEYFISLEHDMKINPFDFGIPDFYVIMPPEELFFNFPSSGNPNKQLIIDVTTGDVKQIDYQYEYDSKGYPVRISNSYWSVFGPNWMSSSHWVLLY